MNKIGVHLMVWSGDVGHAELDRLPDIKKMGYDGVEIPIFGLDTFEPVTVRSAIEEAGLQCTTSTALPEGINLIDEDCRDQGVRWLQDVIKITASLGASVLCGPMIVPVGELRGRGYTEAEWESCIIALKEVGNVAQDHGVAIALEPLNRFETFFFNAVSDGVQMCDAVDNPAIGLLLDTFHMNIEEKSQAQAIQSSAKHIKHFHCSENDRGTVGTGQVPWANVFAALNNANYDGWLTVESFSARIPELAAATCIWRPLAESPDALAKDSLRFIQMERHKLRL
ncbi:MAG: sugar phosphate isomerase/epimerase [Chloroflexota bacterium]